MPTENHVPTGTVSESGWLFYLLSNVNMDDVIWQNPSSNTTSPVLRLSFPTPTGNLTSGPTDQTITVKARKFETGQSGTPTIRIDVYEVGGGTALHTGSEQNLTGTEQSFTELWDADILADISGVDVEVLITITKAGGSPSTRASGSIQFVQWTASYTSGPTYTLTVDSGSYSVTGTAVNLKHDRLLSVAGGSYAKTGTAIGLVHAAVLTLTAGSYAKTGTAITLTHQVTIVTTIGTRASELNPIASVSGSGPYTITLDSEPGPGTFVGDRLIDETATSPAAGAFLITAIAGNDLTVEDVLGAGRAPVAKNPGDDGYAPSYTIRAYATVAAWKTGWTSTTLYAASGNVAKGVMCADSTFDEAVIFDTTSSRPDSFILTAFVPHRHRGIKANGVVWKRTGTGPIVDMDGCQKDFELSWIELDLSLTTVTAIGIQGFTGTRSGTWRLQNNLIHSASSSAGNVAGMFLHSDNPATVKIQNNFIFNLVSSNTGAAACYGIVVDGDPTGNPFNEVYNNSVDTVTNNGGTGVCYGIRALNNHVNETVKNNVATNVGGTTSGTKVCFNFSASATHDYNASSDTTATGSNSLINVTPADIFVSVGNDLHQKYGSALIGKGVDLGVTPIGVNFDIDGSDRDSPGVVWDIGAHQFFSSLPRLIMGRQAINRSNTY